MNGPLLVGTAGVIDLLALAALISASGVSHRWQLAAGLVLMGSTMVGLFSKLELKQMQLVLTVVGAAVFAWLAGAGAFWIYDNIRLKQRNAGALDDGDDTACLEHETHPDPGNTHTPSKTGATDAEHS